MIKLDTPLTNLKSRVPFSVRNRLRPIWYQIRKSPKRIIRRILSALGLPIRLHGIWIKPRFAASETIVQHLVLGNYEAYEINALSTLLRPGDRLLEVGSGLGLTACYAAKRIRPGGRVISFDANPSIVERAQKHQRMNRLTNIAFRCGVLQERAGEVPFHVALDFWESSLDPKPGTQVITTPAHSVASILRELEPTIAMVDIEGGEYQLLSLTEWGACSSLRRLIVEFHPVADAAKKLNTTRLFTAPWKASLPIAEVLAAIEHGNCTVTFKR